MRTLEHRFRDGFRTRLTGVRQRLHAPPAPGDPYWAHRYFTDGVRLYRFIGWVGKSLGCMVAELEDCASLDVMLVRVEGQRLRGLRPLPAC